MNSDWILDTTHNLQHIKEKSSKITKKEIWENFDKNKKQTKKKKKKQTKIQKQENLYTSIWEKSKSYSMLIANWS